MIPVADVIPTRVAPAATIIAVALTTVAGRALGIHWLLIAVATLFLWLFGWTVEDRLGRVRFAFLYLGCGAAAAAIGLRADAISGAVSGVIGAYFALYPRSWMLWFVPAPPWLVEVPVAVMLAVWAMLQLAAGAVAAQAAGFALGAALCFAIRRPARMRVDWWCPTGTSH